MAENTKKRRPGGSGYESRNTPLGLRVTASLKAALEAAADDDSRTVNAMTEKILGEYLRKHGYLTADTPPRRRTASTPASDAEAAS